MSTKSSDPFDPDPEAGFPEEDDLYARREKPERGPQGRREQRPPRVSDFVRRAIENTVGTVGNTGSMSRDALEYLLKQGDKGRKEVVRIVAHEVGDFLRNTDLSGEVVKILTSVQVDFNASVRFRRTQDDRVKPQIDPEISVHTTTPEPEAEAPEAPDRGSTPPARNPVD